MEAMYHFFHKYESIFLVLNIVFIYTMILKIALQIYTIERNHRKFMIAVLRAKTNSSAVSLEKVKKANASTSSLFWYTIIALDVCVLVMHFIKF